MVARFSNVHNYLILVYLRNSGFVHVRTADTGLNPTRLVVRWVSNGGAKHHKKKLKFKARCHNRRHVICSRAGMELNLVTPCCILCTVGRRELGRDRSVEVKIPTAVSFTRSFHQ